MSPGDPALIARSPPTTGGPSTRAALCKPGGGLSPGPEPRQTFTLNSAASRTVRSHILVVSALQPMVFCYGGLSGPTQMFPYEKGKCGTEA